MLCVLVLFETIIFFIYIYCGRLSRLHRAVWFLRRACIRIYVLFFAFFILKEYHDATLQFQVLRVSHGREYLAQSSGFSSTFLAFLDGIGFQNLYTP